MKAKRLLSYVALLIGFILLGCSNDGTDSNSNSVSMIPKAPSGAKNQVFTQGATVSNLVVVGSNVRWYALDRNMVDIPGEVDDQNLVNLISLQNRILLSPQTILKDKELYFATQTVNNIESSDYFTVGVRILNDH